MRTLTGVVILCLLAGFAAGEEVYYDYAPVSWVKPVTRTEEHRRETMCPPREPGATEAAHGGAGVTGMIAAMKSLVRPHDAPACNRSSPGLTRVVAYRVGYVYAGEEYVRVLDHDPGNRVRVRVSLEARP
jgi:hypothetical protein